MGAERVPEYVGAVDAGHVHGRQDVVGEVVRTEGRSGVRAGPGSARIQEQAPEARGERADHPGEAPAVAERARQQDEVGSVARQLVREHH